MNSFKAYFKIAKKHLNSSIMYLCIFWGIAILLVMNNKTANVESFKSTRVDIAVYDKSQSELSGALYQYLSDTQTIVELEEEDSVWKDAMYTHKVEYILVIPEDFGQKLEAADCEGCLIGYKAPGTKYGMFVEMKINQFIRTYHTYISLGKAEEEAYRLTVSTLQQEAEVSLESGEKAGEEAPSYASYFRYVPYVLPCILLMSVTPCISAFHQKEVRKRGFCGKVPYLNRNVQIAAAAVCHSMIFMAVIIGAGYLLYGKEMGGVQMVLYGFNVAAHTAACLGLAFAVAQFTVSLDVSNMVSNVYSLASSFLCGVFVPRIYLPDTVMMVGHAFPAYWYINLHETAWKWTWDSMELRTVLLNLLMQVGFGLAFLCFGLAAGKKKK